MAEGSIRWMGGWVDGWMAANKGGICWGEGGVAWGFDDGFRGGVVGVEMMVVVVVVMVHIPPPPRSLCFFLFVCLVLSCLFCFISMAMHTAAFWEVVCKGVLVPGQPKGLLVSFVGLAFRGLHRDMDPTWDGWVLCC